jgi:hypothetical protein
MSYRVRRRLVVVSKAPCPVQNFRGVPGTPTSGGHLIKLGPARAAVASKVRRLKANMLKGLQLLLCVTCFIHFGTPEYSGARAGQASQSLQFSADRFYACT